MTPTPAGAPRLLRLIGEDGPVEVHEGVNESGQPVLVRRVLPALTRDPARLRALHARLDDLRTVRHPLLLSVLDRVEVDDELWVVEEREEGTPLSALAATARGTGEPLPPPAVLYVVTQLCNALEGLHSQPSTSGEDEFILHLGLRPDAVVITAEGGIKVGCYGLFRPQLGGPGTLPAPDSVAFLSPEQTRPDQKLTPASDLFSVGALLYELLVGEPLFQEESALSTIEAIRRADVAEAVRGAAVLLPGVERVLQRTLNLNPRHRYQRAFVLREDLRGLMAGVTFSGATEELKALAAAAAKAGAAPPTPRPPTPPRPPRPVPLSLLPLDEKTDAFGLPTFGTGMLPEEESSSEDLFPIDEVMDVPEELAQAAAEPPEPAAEPAPQPDVLAGVDPSKALVSAEGHDLPPQLQESSLVMAADEHSLFTRLEAAGLDLAAVKEKLAPKDEDTTSLPLPPELPPPPAVPQPQPQVLAPPAPRSEAPVAPAERSPTPPPLPPPAAVRAVVPAEAPAKAPLPRITTTQAPPPERAGLPLAAVIGAILGLGTVCGVGLYLAAPHLGARLEQAAEDAAASAPQGEAPPREPVASAPPPAEELDPLVAAALEGAAPRDAAPVATPSKASAPVAAPRDATPRDATPRSAPAATESASSRAAPDRAAEPASDRTAVIARTEPEAPIAPPVAAPPLLDASDAALADMVLDLPTSGPAAGGIDFAGYAPAAARGRLDPSAVLALETVETTDPDFTRARSLLLMDSERRGDTSAARRYLDELMSLPENRYNPVLLTEQARSLVRAGQYKQALSSARKAEQYWARLPSELVFSKKAEIYEIQAAASQGLFYQSGQDMELLDESIRLWERYREHVSARGLGDQVAHADEELSQLTELRTRLQ